MNDVITSMVGETFTLVYGNKGDYEMVFERPDGTKIRFYHEDECCEDVRIEDVCGDLSDLIGSPLTLAEESSNEPEPERANNEYGNDSYTWTFYKFATVKGSVTVRWLGESNGYYSESVDVSDSRVEDNTP